MTSSFSIDPALARTGLLTCDLRGCGRPRRGLGRYCLQHAINHGRTGHPVALHISRRTWAPFVRQAETFVLAQLRAGHPSIEEALRLISSELAQAQRPTEHNTTRLLYQAALLRAHRNGVSATDFLARVVAAYLADDRGREVGPRFASDTHFIHQAARLFLLPKPFGREGWARRKREPQAPRETGRLTWGTRVYTFKFINGALGLLANRPADTINQRGL